MSAICLHCGELEQVEVLEVYASGEFDLATCCEGMRDQVNEFLAEDPKAAAQWLATLGHGGCDLPVLPALHENGLRRVIESDGQLLLDWNLEVVPIAWARAKAFIADHHRHCPAPAGWRFGAGVRNGSRLVGVVSVGRPVARALDHTKVVEVNRLCVRTDVPQGMTWNACSLLYGWAAREARKRGFERVITYTMDGEPGTTLKAAGWSVSGTVKGRSWSSPSRPRASGAPIDKTRWSRELR